MSALRDAFEAEAAMVETSRDALPRIRARVADRSRRRRRITIGLAAAVTAVAAAAVSIVVIRGTSDPTLTGPAPQPGESSVQPSPDSVAPVPPSVRVRVPVYFVSTVDGRIALYREFRTVSVTEDTVLDRVSGAVGLALRGDALDPDYRSAWPSTAGVKVGVTPTEVRVDLLEVRTAFTFDEPDLQQIVWTVTAVIADMGESPRPVHLTVDGTDLGQLSRAAAVDMVAPLWIVTPQEGDSVDRTFTVQLAGIVFEATARLRVRGVGGSTVYDEMVMLSLGAPAMGTASVSLTLPPGTYTVEAYYRSAQDGSERGLDNHEITVR